MRDGSKSPLRILVVCDTVGATQQISFAQPLQDVIESGQVVLEMVKHDPLWAEPAACRALWALHDPDVLILSRYTSGLADGVIASARATGAPVIFHIDDDLLNVPESLGKSKFDHYNQPARLAALRSALDASDLVYASTSVLADQLMSNGIQTPVISGDVYCSMDPANLFKPLPATGPVIGYMATGGHGADLDLVMPALERLMTEFPELQFETFGTIGAANRLAPFGARVRHHKGVGDYQAFLNALGDLGWWIGIAPLEDTAFNRCKADTKWVEYSYAGIATVASDLPVYQRACADGTGVLADNDAAWYESLRHLIVDRTHRHKMTAAARELLIERYSRLALQQQLLGVIQSAMDSAKPIRTGRTR